MKEKPETTRLKRRKSGTGGKEADPTRIPCPTDLEK
jgi:hypothetical protein